MILFSRLRSRIFFRKNADVIQVKVSKVKQKAIKQDDNLEGFIAVPEVTDESTNDFLKFEEMNLSRHLLKGISVSNQDLILFLLRNRSV